MRVYSQNSDQLVHNWIAKIHDKIHFTTESRYTLDTVLYNYVTSVPGGWSDWSEWIQCDIKISRDRTDQCSCSTRECNNPTPLNNGTPCAGESKKVRFNNLLKMPLK